MVPVPVLGKYMKLLYLNRHRRTGAGIVLYQHRGLKWLFLYLHYTSTGTVQNSTVHIRFILQKKVCSNVLKAF